MNKIFIGHRGVPLTQASLGFIFPHQCQMWQTASFPVNSQPIIPFICQSILTKQY